MAGSIRPAVADPANEPATFLNRSDRVPASVHRHSRGLFQIKL